MTNGVQRRELHVLIPDSSGAALLATDDGALPTSVVELLDGDTTVMAARRAIRDAWGADRPLLEIHFDYDLVHDDDGSAAVPTLVVMEASAAGWSAPDGNRWRRVGDPDPRVAPGLQSRLRELLAERRGIDEVAPLRPPWSRPGWYSRASRWIRERLIEQGRPPTGPIEQTRHWGISALMRVETATGRVWFKAVFPSFGHEPAVTALLHREAPGSVAPVLAIDEDEGWLLLEDIGSDVVEAHPEADGAAARQLVARQRQFVGRAAELTAIGCPARPFAKLPDDLAAVLADPLALAWIAVTPERADAIVVWTRRALDVIATLPFPETLVHGDFHPRNVVLVDAKPVIFDWSDAAVAHPLVDAMTWSSWLRHDVRRGEQAWRIFLDAWADVCPIERIEPVRPTLFGLAAGYHTVSYAGIVAGLEPVRRPEMADGLRYYFERLDAAVPR